MCIIYGICILLHTTIIPCVVIVHLNHVYYDMHREYGIVLRLQLPFKKSSSGSSSSSGSGSN